MTAIDPQETRTVIKGVIVDRRRYPRVEIKRPGQVVRPDGKYLRVVVHDVSPDGVQIRCERAKAVILHPEARAIGPGEWGPEMNLVFALPLKAGNGVVKVVGRIAFFALINPNLVALGVYFRRASPASLKHIRTFIEESLEPRAEDLV